MSTEPKHQNIDQRLMYILNSVQEYTEQRLLALDRTGLELVVDTFRFPYCYRG